jgi:hypothetical protein
MNSFKCVPTMPPAGWTGYFALYDGPAAQFSGCGTMFPMMKYTGNNQIMAPPATCPCNCGNPTGGTCQIPPVAISDAACGQAGFCSCPVTPPAGYTENTCFNFPVPMMAGKFYECGGTTCGQQMGSTSCNTGTMNCTVSAKVGTSTVSGSSCTPSATMPMKPPVMWGSLGDACGGAQPGKGCTDTSATCMPIPTAPFHSGICIMQAGMQQCPAGMFTDTHVFYSATNDTRGCTACMCGTATGDTCTVTWTLYSDTAFPPACEMQELMMGSGTCSAFSGNPSITSAKATITSPPSGGTCTPINGQPTGTVTPTNPTTFCCIP